MASEDDYGGEEGHAGYSESKDDEYTSAINSYSD